MNVRSIVFRDQNRIKQNDAKWMHGIYKKVRAFHLGYFQVNLFRALNENSWIYYSWCQLSVYSDKSHRTLRDEKYVSIPAQSSRLLKKLRKNTTFPSRTYWETKGIHKKDVPSHLPSIRRRVFLFSCWTSRRLIYSEEWFIAEQATAPLLVYPVGTVHKNTNLFMLFLQISAPLP